MSQQTTQRKHFSRYFDPKTDISSQDEIACIDVKHLNKPKLKKFIKNIKAKKSKRRLDNRGGSKPTPKVFGPRCSLVMLESKNNYKAELNNQPCQSPKNNLTSRKNKKRRSKKDRGLALNISSGMELSLSELENPRRLKEEFIDEEVNSATISRIYEERERTMLTVRKGDLTLQLSPFHRRPLNFLDKNGEKISYEQGKSILRYTKASHTQDKQKKDNHKSPRKSSRFKS